VEKAISPEGNPWTLAGTVVTGKVDRLEQHPALGIRLIDFKTSSPWDAQKRKRRTVSEHHLTPLRKSQSKEDFPAWSLARQSDESTLRWADLQLPLYCLALAKLYPAERVVTAHATLGRTEADVGLDVWEALEGSLIESAQACAEGVIQQVQRRVFWPPVENAGRGDEFDEMLFGDPLMAVDPTALVEGAKA
jgi:hypothetical protein